MTFAIQVSNPKWIELGGKIFEDIYQAVQYVFVADTEDAILFWNHVPVKLSYKYDLYVMIWSLLDLLEEIVAQEHGESRVRWGSNTFDGEWLIKWAGSTIDVTARWISVVGNHEEHLNRRPSLCIEKDEFLGEWASLLDQLQRCLNSSGVRIAGDDLGRISKLTQGIKMRGVLYRASGCAASDAH